MKFTEIIGFSFATKVFVVLRKCLALKKDQYVQFKFRVFDFYNRLKSPTT